MDLADDGLKPAIARYPATLSRSPLPVRSSGRIGYLEYGSGFGPPQAHQRCPAAPRNRPDSRFGDPGKVNRFCPI